MKKPPKTIPAYYQLLELSDRVKVKTYQRTIVEERLTLNELVRNKLDGKSTVAIKDLNWTNLSNGWDAGLSDRAALFVIRHIVPNVKHSNMLFYYPPPTRSTEREVIAELIRDGILARTESVGMYLIDPLRIWRGNPLTVIEATKQLLRDEGKPSPEMIRDLRPGTKYIIRSSADAFKQLGYGAGEDIATEQ